MIVLPLYDKYFIRKDDERQPLFQILSEKYEINSGIYPGSFVHITPSLYIPQMTYIDNDRRINKFFSDPKTIDYINRNKNYSNKPIVNWLQEDFTKPLEIKEKSFDIMFSFYAGFISQYCKSFLKENGLLITNNSHGDATLAITDKDFKCIGVVIRNGQKFRIKTDALNEFITKKNGTEIDIKKVKDKMIGEKFAKYAYAYVFQKI